MEKPIIFTIGHSTHTIDVFYNLLKTHSINVLIDVRSIAASSYNPQFNKEPFSKYLELNNIQYFHFAEEFGARHSDPDLLDDDGKVNFEQVRKSWNFKKGVEKLWEFIDKDKVVVLMCSESEPFDCHRFSMISFALSKEGFEVIHILKDNTTKTNEQLEFQLLKKYEKKLQKPDMFQPNITANDQLKEAYRLRNKEIAFSPYSRQVKQENDD